MLNALLVALSSLSLQLPPPAEPEGWTQLGFPFSYLDPWHSWSETVGWHLNPSNEPITISGSGIRPLVNAVTGFGGNGGPEWSRPFSDLYHVEPFLVNFSYNRILPARRGYEHKVGGWVRYGQEYWVHDDGRVAVRSLQGQNGHQSGNEFDH